MPQSLYLDEDVPSRLKDWLLHNAPGGSLQVALATQENPRASDAVQLQYAAGTKAILITHNIKDFRWLHRWWKALRAWGPLLADPHAGILAAQQRVGVEELGAEILKFLTQRFVPPLEDNMYTLYFHRGQGNWVHERW